jgi:hypothetical protein
MSQIGQARATVADLYRTEGKAELIGGRIVEFAPCGHKPALAGARIARSLDDHATKSGKGEAYVGNIGFIIPELSSGRESFSPDASFYDGPLPANPMHFIEGAPNFAAEVRRVDDYEAAADIERCDKRSDYFGAGTKVVWDVDPVAECIHVYKSADPTHPIAYGRGQFAEAEPAIPGWRVAVDWIFS